VNREQFEASVLDLWVTTRIPLSRAHLQYHTGVGRQRIDRWLDELTGEGVLECDVSEDGEMLWRIPGAARSRTGPQSFAELERGGGAAPRRPGRSAGRVRPRADEDAAEEAVASLSRAALTLAKKGSGPPARGKGKGAEREQKSLAVSAGLSFLGPVGWLYAGSLREAAIGTALAVLVWKLAPSFLLMPILWLALPLSAIIGVLYAWQYNRRGERTPLFLDGKKDNDAD
jgi:hypothetical protein